MSARKKTTGIVRKGADGRSAISLKVKEEEEDEDSRGPHRGEETPQDIELKERLKRISKRMKDLDGQRDELLSQVRELNEEKDTLINQIQDITKEHKEEQENLTGQLEKLREKQRVMQERVDRVERIENAIINLYLEMKDRSAEEGEPDLAQERNELKKINQPLVVLDFLRANLRNLLAFKEDYENELKNQIARKKTDQEEMIFNLQKTIDKHMETTNVLEDTANNAVKKMKEAETAKELVIDESQSLIEQIKEDNRKLIELTRTKEDEVRRLRGTLEKREQIIRNQDMKLLRIAQLESQIQFNKMQHQADLNKLQTQHVKTLQLLQKEMGKFTKTEAENKLYEEKLSQATIQVNAYRKDIRRTRFEEVEKKMQKQERQIMHQQDTIDQMTKDLRRANLAAEDNARKNAQLKKEYDKLFNAVNQEQMKKKKDQIMQKEKKGDIHKQADENPFFVDFYRSKLREKEREVDELQSKVKRLLASEHKATLAEKSFQIERQRLESEIATLRVQAVEGRRGGARPSSASRTRASVASSRAWYNGEDDPEVLAQRNKDLEDQLTEFKNMKTISATMSTAYDRLVDAADLTALQTAKSAMAGGGGGSHAEAPGELSVDFEYVEDSTTDTVPKVAGTTMTRPRSAGVGGGHSDDRSPAPPGRNGSRPMSAMGGRKLNVGSSKSNLQVKSLLRASTDN